MPLVIYDTSLYQSAPMYLPRLQTMRTTAGLLTRRFTRTYKPASLCFAYKLTKRGLFLIHMVKGKVRIIGLRAQSKPAHYRSRSSQQEHMHTTALSDGATPSASFKAVSSNGRTREFHSLNASSILAIVTK